MKNVMICGLQGSGKTCYFLGMIKEMMAGINGFSIFPVTNYADIVSRCNRLTDTKLPMSARVAATDQVEYYDLELRYNMSPITRFRWIDYPGEYVRTMSESFQSELQHAFTLLVCIDGELFKKNRKNIVPVLQNNGGNELNGAIGVAAAGGYLPPICIVVTKSDILPRKYLDAESMVPVLRQVFPTLFNRSSGGKIARLVAVSQVSLGKRFVKKAIFDPIHVEEPICYAAGNIVMYETMDSIRKLANSKKSLNAAKAEYQRALEEYNNMPWYKRLSRLYS